MINLFIYAIVFFTVLCLARRYEMFCTVIILICYTSLLYTHNFDKIVCVQSILIGIVMPILEYACIKSRTWTYHGSYYSIPMWLPILWSCVAIFVFDTNNAIKKLLSA